MLYNTDTEICVWPDFLNLLPDSNTVYYDYKN